MDINAQRQIVSGVAGAGLWVGHYTGPGTVPMKNVRTNCGNGPSWLGDRVLLDDFSVGLGTCQADGTDFQPFAPPRAASWYGGASASSGAWGAYLADTVTGVYTSWSLTRPDCRWLGAGPALFIKPSSGQGLIAYDWHGTSPRWVIPSGESIDFYAESADAVIWTDGRRLLNVRDLPQPAQTEPIFMPSTFVANGRRWLLYARGNGGCVVRPWEDASEGYIVVPEGQNSFSPTAIPGDTDTDVIVCWSPNAAETVIQAAVVNLTGPTQPLTPTPPDPPIPPFPPDPPVPPIPPIPPVPPVRRHGTPLSVFVRRTP